jgi:hypothetical protein
MQAGLSVGILDDLVVRWLRQGVMERIPIGNAFIESPSSMVGFLLVILPALSAHREKVYDDDYFSQEE